MSEVRSPGIYSLYNKDEKTTQRKFHRIVDALVESGGLTKNLNIRNIELVRKIPESKKGGIKKSQIRSSF